jgi:hypothetical protein
MGVIRHVDASKEYASDIAVERGVRVPMRGGPVLMAIDATHRDMAQLPLDRGRFDLRIAVGILCSATGGGRMVLARFDPVQGRRAEGP